MKRWVLAVLLCWLSHGLAQAQEHFPGQNDLAAGLTCYRNLDFDCARARLEQALARFAPEQDQQFLTHVREVRQMLALIFVASDELEKAEREFRKLLLLEPSFDLPVGDHPPKVRYVLARARKALSAQKKAPAKKDPPPKKSPPLKPVPPLPPSPTPKNHTWSLAAGGSWTVLFGEDKETLDAGLGPTLALGFQASRLFSVETALNWTYHPNAQDGPALRAFGLVVSALASFGSEIYALRCGITAGVLSMGTRDRYDHWGMQLGLRASAVWPSTGNWGLIFSVRPSLFITREQSSFYIPLELAGEIRW